MCTNEAGIEQGSVRRIWIWKDSGAGGESPADCLGDALQQDQLNHLPLQFCGCRGKRKAQPQRVSPLSLPDVDQQALQRDHLSQQGQALQQ